MQILMTFNFIWIDGLENTYHFHKLLLLENAQFDIHVFT